MRTRTDDMLYANPTDIPLSVTLEELTMLRDLIGGCTMGEATESRVQLYVELTRTLNEAREAVREFFDPWNEWEK